MLRRGRTPTTLLAGLVLAAAGARAEPIEVHGVAAGRVYAVEGQTSWLQGGWGRLTEGAGAPDETLAGLRGRAHLGIDVELGATLRFHAHGTVQGEPGSSRGRRGGLVEAFFQYQPELSPRTTLRVRAGLFFPPTSLENTDELWQSPYTVTLSALNTWIAEEIRLGGLEAQLRRRLGQDDRLEVAGAAFAVNDPAGALLAWRGWTLGDRISTLGEPLPLPPLVTLEPGGPFADQRDDGTLPVHELDAHLGFHARARFTRPGVAVVQAAYTDNLGDRGLHRGQYSWATRFAQVGVQLQLGKAVTLVAEGMVGDTGMGPVTGPRVDTRFRAAYALVSGEAKGLRLSARLDSFRNRDRDGTAEPNDEDGWSFTLAAFWRPRPFVRLGVEYLELRADRPAAAFSGQDPDTDARRGLAELRLSF
jgi:hypothetical protein